jgi:3'-phosphoadenosine 5'-phosphosulfate sulfotransferase (PAPS reductase)/FAD synthetase
MATFDKHPWLADVQRTLADAVERHGRVALLYSGGIESSLLLHLAEPWRDNITVYTVRTGAEFPHMTEFIDRKLHGWDHRVIRTDLVKSFGELGLPASAVPIEHTAGIGEAININERQPRIVPWLVCCVQNRNAPGYEAVKADGITAAVTGQRSGDWPKSAAPTQSFPGLEFIPALWSVSRSEVQAAVDYLSIELPDHYGDYPSSLDCSVCPSCLTSKRRAWMAQRYPEALVVAEGLHSEVTKAVIAALDGDNTFNNHTVR